MRTYIYELASDRRLPISGFRTWRIQSIGCEIVAGVGPCNARIILDVRGITVWDISTNYLASGELETPAMFYIAAAPQYPNDGGAAGLPRAIMTPIPNTVFDGGKEEITGELRIQGSEPTSLGPIWTIVVEADPVLRARARGLQGVAGASA